MIRFTDKNGKVLRIDNNMPVIYNGESFYNVFVRNNISDDYTQVLEDERQTYAEVTISKGINGDVVVNITNGIDDITVRNNVSEDVYRNIQHKTSEDLGIEANITITPNYGETIRLQIFVDGYKVVDEEYNYMYTLTDEYFGQYYGDVAIYVF